MAASQSANDASVFYFISLNFIEFEIFAMAEVLKNSTVFISNSYFDYIVSF